MSRTVKPTNARARTLAILMAVSGAAFVMAGVVTAIVLAAAGSYGRAGLLALGVYTLAALLGTTAIGGAFWLIAASEDAAPHSALPHVDDGDPVELWEGSFEAQRQLLDDVRHELKTPITIIRGHLEIMNADDAADVDAVRAIGIAELDRMTRLVNDIDLLAAVQGDGFSFGFVDLDVLTERIGELVAVIPQHVWSIEQIAHSRIRGDRDRLLQAWLQLADNAAKYTPPGSPIEIGSAVHSAGVQLWVRDHGGGIPAAARHRIFRRFDRADGKRTIGGSGLGLAIVDTIARGHGGRCFVSDTHGGGATFTIEIPTGTGAATPSPIRAGDVVEQRGTIG